MSDIELAKYLESCLNAGLKTDAESSSLTNSFKIRVNQDKGYFDFIPAFPGPFKLTKDTSDAIQTIASGALFPYKTLLGLTAANLIKTGIDNIHLARGLRFFFVNGSYERINIDNVDSNLLVRQNGKLYIRLQENTLIDPKCPCIGISGRSGSGKSICENLLLSGLNQYINAQDWDWADDWMSSEDETVKNLLNGKIISQVDPKLDINLFEWCRNHDINYFYPNEDISNSEFLNTINEKESEFIKILHYRQKQLIERPCLKFAPLVMSIDEVQFATSVVSRQSLGTFQSLTDQIILTARSASGLLMLTSAAFPIPGSISSSSRDGMLYKLILSNGFINKTDTRFLIKDFEPSTILTMPDECNFGNGLIEHNGIISTLKVAHVKNLRG